MRITAGCVLCVLLLASCAMGQTTLNAGRATFPYPIYSKWFNEYRKAHPGGDQLPVSNIAEDVIFWTSGEDIRHGQHSTDRQP